MDESYVMTATDLMNYAYCPRIIYFTHVLKKPQSTTKKEYVGRNKSNIFEKNARRAKVVRDQPKYPKLFGCRLFSSELGMRTIADSIMINTAAGEAYPVQAKHTWSRSIIYSGQRLQLMMEGLLIERGMGFSVPHGFIKFTRTGELAKVSLSDKGAVMECLKSIKSILSAECVPAPTKFRRRCADCCYRNIC